jgi:chromosome segregation ATPase
LITFITKLIKERDQTYQKSITFLQETIKKHDSKKHHNEAKLNQANLEKKQLEFKLSQTKHQIGDCEAQLKQQKEFLEKRTKDMERKLKYYENFVENLRVRLKNSLRTRFSNLLFYHFYKKSKKGEGKKYQECIAGFQDTINNFRFSVLNKEVKLKKANEENKNLQKELLKRTEQIKSCEEKLKQQKVIHENGTKEIEEKLMAQEILVQSLKKGSDQTTDVK